MPKYNYRKAFFGKNNQRALRTLAIQAAKNYAGSGMYTGRGSYIANNLMSGATDTNSIPRMRGSGNETGDIYITHTEYLTDVFGPTVPFDVQSFQLNPGLASVFPWLAQIAANYEEYEFQQLVFKFRSTTTDIGSSTTGQCGTVIMATNYNAASPVFSDKPTMMEYAHAHSSKTTENLVHGVECDPYKLAGDQCKYIRTAAVAGFQDIKTYDHGLFQLAVANSPTAYANLPIGELWVYYTVRLSKPRLYVGLGREIQIDNWCSSTTSGASIVSGALFIAGGQSYYAQQNNLGVEVTKAYGGNNKSLGLTFPAGLTGSFEIVIMTSGGVGGTGVAGDHISYCQGTTVSGNITTISDLNDQNGTPNGVFRGQPATLAAGGEADCVTIHHIYVSPATGGVDNIFKLDDQSDGTTPAFWQLSIRRYNSQGLLSLTGSRAIYVNASTQSLISQQDL